MTLCKQILSKSYGRRARLHHAAALYAIQTTRFLHDWLPQSFFTSCVKLELTKLPPDKSRTYTSLAVVGVSGSAASHIGVPDVSVLAASQPGTNNSTSPVVGVSGLVASRVGVSDASSSENSTSPAACVGSASVACHLGIPDVSGLAASTRHEQFHLNFHLSCRSWSVGFSCIPHWSSMCFGVGVPSSRHATILIIYSWTFGFGGTSSAAVVGSSSAASHVGLKNEIANTDFCSPRQQQHKR
jgi:hypothetical protein